MEAAEVVSEVSQRALLDAAKAVVDRWDTPLWEDVHATAGYINRLRDAIADVEGPSAGVVGPETDTLGKICRFYPTVGGQHAEFFDDGEGHGYRYCEPLPCPITGSELGPFGFSDSNGNTGDMHFRAVTAEDYTLVWEAFNGEGLYDPDMADDFLDWLHECKVKALRSLQILDNLAAHGR